MVIKRFRVIGLAAGIWLAAGCLYPQGAVVGASAAVGQLKEGAVSSASPGQSELAVISVETTILQAGGILRYDIRIKNNGRKTLRPKFDYPGHHAYPIEVTVRPGKRLSKLMVMDKESRYRKMQFRSSGSGGYLQAGQEVGFYVEYRIKDGVEAKRVEANALDGDLLVLDGPATIAEFPLRTLKQPHK